MTEPKLPETPAILDKFVDMVLAYKPKSKSDSAKKRKKQTAKIAKATDKPR